MTQSVQKIRHSVGPGVAQTLITITTKDGLARGPNLSVDGGASMTMKISSHNGDGVQVVLNLWMPEHGFDILALVPWAERDKVIAWMASCLEELR